MSAGTQRYMGLTIKLKPEGWDQQPGKCRGRGSEAEGTVGANDPRQEGDGSIEEQQGGWRGHSRVSEGVREARWSHRPGEGGRAGSLGR